MKTLTYFSEKGGVGKSSHCILMASYLHYCLGRSVVLFDFDAPMFRVYEYRQREQRLLYSESNRNLLRFMSDRTAPYEVVRIKPDGPLNSYTQSMVSANIVPLINSFRSSGKYDCCIFDFPGRFDDDDILASLVKARQLDFVAVPFNLNRPAVESALYVCMKFRNMGVECRPFFNRLPRQDCNDMTGRQCTAMEGLFVDNGFRPLDTRIKLFNSMERESSDAFFVQSTFCWPASNVSRSCPELAVLYDEILNLID